MVAADTVIMNPNNQPPPTHDFPRCRDGNPCQSHPSGGTCAQCGYPIAYPASLLDAFRVEAVWINGTAIPVQPQPRMQPNVVCILQRNGSSIEYHIPKEEPPPEGLDIQQRRHLLKIAACLLDVDRAAANALSMALVEGIAALSHGGLSTTHRKMLLQFMKFYRGPQPLMTAHAVEGLLSEVDRVECRERSIHGPGLIVDDNRPNLDVTHAAIGPFLAAMSSIRVALLPGEADHVELYDIRVGERQDCPIGISMISRLPGYGPENVREVRDPVNINGTHVRRYVPGTALAGQLQDGTDPSHPARLSPGDLLGGIQIDLGRMFPPMSYVYLFYRVDPGHVFCAVVEAIEDKNTP